MHCKEQYIYWISKLFNFLGNLICIWLILPIKVHFYSSVWLDTLEACNWNRNTPKRELNEWSNPGNRVASSHTPRYISYWKGTLRVTLDLGCQLTCSIIPLSQLANHVSSGIIRHYVVAFVCLHFALLDTRMLNSFEELCIINVTFCLTSIGRNNKWRGQGYISEPLANCKLETH